MISKMKKYKNLYINGCSFTAGNRVDEEKTWPKLLQKKLNIEMIDDSKNGNSMDTIITTTINQSLKQQSEVLYVIGLTWPGRVGINIGDIMFNWSMKDLRSDTNRYTYMTKLSLYKRVSILNDHEYYPVNIKPDYAEKVYGDAVYEIIKSFNKYIKNRVTYDEKFDTNINLLYFQQILEIQNFFKANNYDYLLVNFNNIIYAECYENDILKPYIDSFDEDRILNLCSIKSNSQYGLDSYRGINFKDEDYEIDLLSAHPSERGCIQISEKVYDFINR